MNQKYPILEYDDSNEVIITPSHCVNPIDTPKCCVLCFFQDVIDKVIKEHSAKIIALCKSEMGGHPLYEILFNDKRLAFIHPGIGAPLAAGLLEEVIALGCNRFIACGGSGVLDSSINLGKVIVPTSAIRDEGTSYHYLPPSREVNADPVSIKVIKEVLEKNNCDYITTKTWTTDGFYRETLRKRDIRKSEGCLVVEMEAAAFFAVAKYRKVPFAQILYAGDDAGGKRWKNRNWNTQTSVREKIFWLAAEACLSI